MSGAKRGSQVGLKPFPKGVSGNPAGPRPKLCKVLKTIPEDAQLRIYEILYRALTFNNVADAMKFIKSQEAANFEYGFVLQLAVKSLVGPQGWQTLNDILDRLFGRPKITAEVKAVSPVLNITTDGETKALIEGGLTE